MTLDSESSADEFEDATDFNNSEYIFSDSPPVQPLNRHLSMFVKQKVSQLLKLSSLSVPNNTNDETSGSAQFVDNYKQRFGEPTPDFYVGSLENALRLACHKPAKEVQETHTQCRPLILCIIYRIAQITGHLLASRREYTHECILWSSHERRSHYTDI